MEIISAIIIPLTTGWVQLIKETELLPKRFLPFVSVFVGIMCTLIFSRIIEMSAWEALIYGMVYGLSATGLYEAGDKALREPEI